MLTIPAQSGLDGDGNLDGIDHAAGNFEHQWDVLQQTRARAFSGHTLHGATKVEVQYIRMRRLLNYLRRLRHRVGEASIYLYGDRPFSVANRQFVQRAAHMAHEGVGSNKFGVSHRSSHLPTKLAEADVGHVLHRCKQ